MRALLTVLFKELLENARDRRTLLSALLIGPLGGPLLFSVMMNLTLERGRERAEQALELPVAGRSGTLENRMKGTPAEGNARVKTGSLTGVRAMAGYVRSGDGETLAFAIFANNYENSSSVVNAACDAIIVRLAAFRR